MKALSIRWKLVLPTMALAIAVALLLVLFQHSRTRHQLLQQLERTLATKCEEVHTLLSSSAAPVDLAPFLEVETQYRSSPHEYFYEIVDGAGTPVLASLNLAGKRLIAGTLPAVDGLLTLPHPLKPGEQLRVRCERLSGAGYGWNEPRLAVGVSLAPFEEEVRAGLIEHLLAALAGLVGLFATLWFVVGRTLRRVAAITRRASTITSTSLRERLPVSGNGDELDELAGVFNEMLAGLRRSLEQMEAFTSDAAHQFRTPLTRVRGELDLVMRDGRRRIDEVLPRLGEVREELDRLSRTCSRLLLLARLDCGTMQEGLLADDIDLSRVVEDIHEQFQPLAAERGVQIRSHYDGEIRVRCSRPLVVEALLNLLDNALRASPGGTQVEVSLRRSASEAMITIADQGPGIPEDLREQVFRRFFRHSGTPDDGGTGLGLAIVRGIARAHGGDVYVETSKWGGAALVLTFPLRRDDARADRSTRSHPALSPA